MPTWMECMARHREKALEQWGKMSAKKKKEYGNFIKFFNQKHMVKCKKEYYKSKKSSSNKY